MKYLLLTINRKHDLPLFSYLIFFSLNIYIIILSHIYVKNIYTVYSLNIYMYHTANLNILDIYILCRYSCCL